MELQRKASTVGFDWNDPRAVLRKIREEADEIEAALDREQTPTNSPKKPVISCSRPSIWLGMSAPIRSLRCAAPTPSSSAALRYIERALAAQGRSLRGATLAEMDALWNEAKARE